MINFMQIHIQIQMQVDKWAHIPFSIIFIHYTVIQISELSSTVIIKLLIL